MTATSEWQLFNKDITMKKTNKENRKMFIH